MMLRKLIDLRVDVENKIRALPLQQLYVGDFFSGSGSFMLIMDAITQAIQKKVPTVGEDFWEP